MTTSQQICSILFIGWAILNWGCDPGIGSGDTCIGCPSFDDFSPPTTYHNCDINYVKGEMTLTFEKADTVTKGYGIPESTTKDFTYYYRTVENRRDIHLIFGNDDGCNLLYLNISFSAQQIEKGQIFVTVDSLDKVSANLTEMPYGYWKVYNKDVFFLEISEVYPNGEIDIMFWGTFTSGFDREQEFRARILSGNATQIPLKL